MKLNKIITVVILISFMSCAPKVSRYIPDSPPPLINIPTSQNLAIVSPPPLLIQSNDYLTKTINKSQYFKIAILPCVDMTGKADHIKNSLADMLGTALFETKRFNFLDRMEVKKVEEVSLSDISSDTSKANIQLREKQLELLKTGSAKKDAMIDRLLEKADGVLMIFITSDEKLGGKESKVRIDSRIVNNGENEQTIDLYAAKNEIGYTYDKQTHSLKFNQNDINDFADEIRKNFPNPDIHEDLKITNKRGNTITVNAGKKDNIITGMLGFVIKIEKDKFNNQSQAYRALFKVKEVFAESFNAELIVDKDSEEEDKIIIPTIKVGEPVRMK